MRHRIHPHHNPVAPQFRGVYAIQMSSLYGRCLIWLALLTIAFGVPAQVIYDTGVTVVTVAGQPGVVSDHDGTGDEVLLGETHGIAALGEVGYATSTFGGQTRIKKIIGRTVTTIAETNSVVFYSDGDRLTADPVRQSVLWNRRDLTFRIGPSGQIITVLQFPAFCSIRSNLVAVPKDKGLWLLDLQTGNYSYLAGGSITTMRDGNGQLSGFAAINGTAMADSIAYVSDQGALRLATLSGDVSTLAASGYVDGAVGIAKASPTQNLVTDKDGNLIFVQQNSIRRLTGNAIKTLAGSPSNKGVFDGEGFNARFSNIQGIAIDGSNRLWIADQNCIRLMTFRESSTQVAPEIGIRLVPAITVKGEIGAVYRIEFQDAAGEPWQLLRVVVLSKVVEEFLDDSSVASSRIYRAVLP
jgi:hypothetical protein